MHLVTGSPSKAVERRLDGKPVKLINSRLRGKPERADPKVLASNAEPAFVGTYVLGMGFTLTSGQREALIAKDLRNGERIFPYLGGEEVNTSPTQENDRYVIGFGQMELSEAEAWPDLLAIVREKVEPERDRLKDNTDGSDYKMRRWQHAKLNYSASGLLRNVPLPRPRPENRDPRARSARLSALRSARRVHARNPAGPHEDVQRAQRSGLR